jgi:molybdenum cofactor cytidylyltransferase
MISAIVLAAGQSKRMGQQKMLLPWGKTTVIGQVVSTLNMAGINDIHIVIGGSQTFLKNVLKNYKVDFLFNKDFKNGEMLISVQVGLSYLGEGSEATLIVLGDQPQIETQVVRAIMERYLATHHEIIVPSYNKHRGHPWLIERSYWQEILNLRPPHTLRNFLNTYNEVIDYINIETPSVIQDLDTQNDYSLYKP